jgi:hypothetical protein
MSVENQGPTNPMEIDDGAAARSVEMQYFDGNMTPPQGNYQTNGKTSIQLYGDYTCLCTITTTALLAHHRILVR